MEFDKEMEEFMAIVDARVYPKYNPNATYCCATVKAGFKAGFMCGRTAIDSPTCHVHKVLSSLKLTSSPTATATTSSRIRMVRFVDEVERQSSSLDSTQSLTTSTPSLTTSYGPMKRERFYSKHVIEFV
jgi:hypothetical protein